MPHHSMPAMHIGQGSAVVYSSSRAHSALASGPRSWGQELAQSWIACISPWCVGSWAALLTPRQMTSPLVVFTMTAPYGAAGFRFAMYTAARM